LGAILAEKRDKLFDALRAGARTIPGKDAAKVTRKLHAISRLASAEK
jgi:hypothetical protein